MRLLRKLADAIERALDGMMIAMFTLMTIAIVWQVFARYVLQSPTAWSEELAMFLLAWVTMLGSALVIRSQEGHIAVTILVDALPAAVQRIIAIIRDALTLATMGALVLYGYRLAIVGSRQTAPGTDIPMTYPYLSIPVGAALIALFMAARRPPAQA